MERSEKRDQDLYIKAGDNHMKINIGNHEFTELWDGFLPVKVKDEVKLADYVYMIIIPSEYKEQLMKVMPEQLSDRAFFLSHDKLDVWQWSEKVYSFVHDMAKSNVNQMEGEKRYEE